MQSLSETHFGEIAAEVQKSAGSKSLLRGGDLKRVSNQIQGKQVARGSTERGQRGLILRRAFQNAKKYFFKILS